jgi:MSHA pilin protein MshC
MRPDGSRYSTSSTGYTLVELVLVLTILGILAAFAAPRFFSQQPFDERAYADALAGALRATQKAAIATGCPARLEIDSSGYRARLPAASGNGCNASDTSWSVPVPLPDGSTISGTASSTVSPASAAIVFSASGMLSSAAPTLAVGPWTITIDATTGYVAVARS